MRLLQKLKIKKELKALKEFKKSFKFQMKEITHTPEGQFCDGVIVEDNNGKSTAESDSWINVSFKFGNPISKLLSNLYPYKFCFRGKSVYSIEAVLQGLKFPDKKSQNHVLEDVYSGIHAYHLRSASPYDWRETGILYWQGKPIKRESEEYYNFIDELYVSAIQNPLYREAIRKTNKYIMHSIGNSDIKQTVLMRCEFEYELNLLKEYLQTHP